MAMGKTGIRSEQSMRDRIVISPIGVIAFIPMRCQRNGERQRRDEQRVLEL